MLQIKFTFKSLYPSMASGGKILPSKIHKCENLENVHNRKYNEGDVTKNWCLVLFSQKTKFKRKSISKICRSNDKDNIMNHFQRIKRPIFIFCYENIGMLYFIISSHVRPYQESKIIQEVDQKTYLSAILLSAYLSLTLAAVCYTY